MAIETGVMRLNEIAPDHITTKRPRGWIIRECFGADGHALNLEYGIYLTDTIFCGIPIHFNLKPRFSPLGAIGDDGTKYYTLPDMPLGVAYCTNKVTHVRRPILVEPSEKHPAVLIACLAVPATGTDQILNVTLADNKCKVLNKYFNKDRKIFAAIVANVSTDILNPQIGIDITTGTVGGTAYEEHKYVFAPFGATSVDTNLVNATSNGQYITHEKFVAEEPVSTSYINLPMFVDKNKKVVPEEAYKRRTRNIDADKTETSTENEDVAKENRYDKKRKFKNDRKNED